MMSFLRKFRDSSIVLIIPSLFKSPSMRTLTLLRLTSTEPGAGNKGIQYRRDPRLRNRREIPDKNKDSIDKEKFRIRIGSIPKANNKKI